MRHRHRPLLIVLLAAGLALSAGVALAQGFGLGMGADDLYPGKGTGSGPVSCSINLQFAFNDKCHLGAWMFR